MNRPAIIAAIGLQLLLHVGCGEAPDLETSRRFQEAEELFAKASEPNQFLRVAGLYQEIIDSGFESGVVFYNQGNAWMQAGQTGRAIASYRQAERIMPRDPYLIANLKQALNDASPSETPILDHVFFWQRSLSYAEKFLAVTVLLAMAILAGLMRQLGVARVVFRNICIATSIVLLLMIVSVARDWLNIENTVHGVVVDDVVARKGGSTTYEPAFTQPLRSGTEFILLESSASDWLRIQLTDDKEGWLPNRAAVTY